MEPLGRPSTFSSVSPQGCIIDFFVSTLRRSKANIELVIVRAWIFCWSTFRRIFEASPVRNAKQRLAKRELRTVVVFSSVTVVVGCGRTSSFLIEFLLACERCSDKLDRSSGMAPRTWHLSTACERTSHDAREQLRRHAVSTMRQSSTRRMTHTRSSRTRHTQRSCLAWLQVQIHDGDPRVWSSLQNWRMSSCSAKISRLALWLLAAASPHIMRWLVCGW